MNKKLTPRVIRCMCTLLFTWCSSLVCGQESPLIEVSSETKEKVATTLEEIPALEVFETSPSINSLPAANDDYVDYTVSITDNLSTPETSFEGGEQKITITLDAVSLEDTLRMFVQTTRANIIYSPNMFTGLFVTVSLSEVDWLPALRSILETHSFTLTERTPGSGVFTVQPRGPDEPEPTSIKTFFLDYTTANDVIDPIIAMHETGDPRSIILFQSRNALVVRSSESNLGELENLIKELDRPGKQILVEAKILELTDEASKQLGIRWDSLEAFGVRAGLGPFTENRESTESFTDNFSDERLRTRESSELDSENRSAESFTISETRSLVQVPGGSGFFNRQESADNQSDSAAFSKSRNSLDSERVAADIFDNFTREITKQQSAILNVDAFELVLSALERTDGVSLVSNPKMIVTSGSTNAFFSVGEQEPIIKTERKEGTAESPGDRITAKLDTEIATDFISGGYLRTGVGLDVVATVKTDDYIEATINPSLRRFLKDKEVEGNSWPIVSVKEIRTSFTLRSGQTVAIGGLTDTFDTQQTSRIPLLGSIPFFGRLFSHTRDVKQQSETIIFVTLSVADPVQLERSSGIPEDARLIHNRMLRMDALAAAATNNQAAVEVQEDDKTRTRGPRGPRR